MPSNGKLRQKKIESLQYAALNLINIIDKSIEKEAFEGVFRISGAKLLMDSKIAEIQQGKMDFATLSQLEQAALLKAVIRELQNVGDPLFSYQKFDDLKKAQEKIYETERQGGEPFNIASANYKAIRNQLLDGCSNKKIAFRLFALLNKISKKPEAKMPPANLAIVMTPNLLKMPQDMPLPMQGLVTVSMNAVCSDLIENFHEIKKPPLHLLGTHYEAQVQNVSENRFHLFNATSKQIDPIYKKFKGDQLKSRILLNFKKQLEDIKSPESFDQAVDNLIHSEEYKVLATSQGLATWVLSWFGQRDTSSVKAFREMVAERRSDLEFEKTLGLK